MKRVVLASASPRRSELLAALIGDFEVVPSDVPEDLKGDPVEDALRLATAKAAEVAGRNADAVVIGCDTIVHDGERPFGKPVDEAEAATMLRALRGRAHRVVTGLSVIAQQRVLTAHSEATVWMRDLDDRAIADYVASGRPLDKAGAYAIQDEDVPTVAGLDGCYCCVVGLPLWRLRSLLIQAGVVCADPARAYPRCSECPEREL